MGKVKVGIYFYLTANILTKVFCLFFFFVVVVIVVVIVVVVVVVAVHSGEHCGPWASGY